MKPNVFVPLSFLFLLSTAQAATVTKTSITQTSVTPTSAPAGTMFKFTATLNAPLTADNKVKIDLGKGLASMTGAKTSYSLSRAIFTTGAQTYKVGIYNAKGILQGVVKSGDYTVSTVAPVVNHVPTLKLASAKMSATANEIYTVTLNAKDEDGNLDSITMNWGDGSEPETLAATDSVNLVFSHTYTTAKTFTWKAMSKDRGLPNLSSKAISRKVNVTSKYAKVCNSGALAGEEDCPIDPVLGNAPTDWACTQDNKTGLIWEVKMTDGGLHDQNKMYTNYTPDYPKCNDSGDGWCSDYTGKLGDSTNTDVFVTAVNTQTLCGANDWRMPTKDELLGIVKAGASNPSIDTAYFPNTVSNWFWSASVFADVPDYAWFVFFNSGYDSNGNKGFSDAVRLVRGGQSF